MIYLEIKLLFLTFLAISIVADNKNDILSLLENLPDKDLKALADSITDEKELNLLSELTHRRTTTTKSTRPSLKIPQGCSKKKEQKGKIIQASASTKLGAELLNSTDDFRSQLGCEKACCATPRCHLAVYEMQDDDDGVHTCYLFNCGPKGDSCSLGEHDKYVSVYMDRSSSPTPTTLTPTTTTTKASPTKPPSKSDLEGDLHEADLEKEANQKAGGAALFKRCHLTEDCAGDHGACRKGFCLCTKGYAVRNGACRKKCSALEFECTNLAASLTGPDCVGAEQVCDGSQDCPDASDEEGCEDVETTKPSVNDKETNPKSEEGAEEGASTPASNSSLGIEKTIVDTVSEADGERDSAGKSGAVVALALSLTLTFIMLVYVGCRLRKVKSRIRGRGGHGLKTAQADYLINGMYL